MSLHTQLLRGLFALPAAILIAIAGLMAPQASATPCEVADAHATPPRVEAIAGHARAPILRGEVAAR